MRNQIWLVCLKIWSQQINHLSNHLSLNFMALSLLCILPCHRHFQVMFLNQFNHWNNLWLKTSLIRLLISISLLDQLMITPSLWLSVWSLPLMIRKVVMLNGCSLATMQLSDSLSSSHLLLQRKVWWLKRSIKWREMVDMTCMGFDNDDER